MKNDLTFFTNEPPLTLLDRFKKTLKDVKYFDVLVGYFRSSGFHLLYESLENVDEIRILVGLNVDKRTYDLIQTQQAHLDFESHKQTKAAFRNEVVAEVDAIPDRQEIELSVRKFIEFLNSGKMRIRAYPGHPIHAKVYISRFSEDDRDYGRVITGSSNFSQSGLVDNLEFNVELKDTADVEYALSVFEKLWEESVDVSAEFVETINHSTWLNDSLSPYEIYLKFLYEYFKEDINLDEDFDTFLPEGFVELAYQKQAVMSSRKILETYNGVFVSDVVGLGKTFICALLAQQLRGRILVICPPVLMDYWRETFFEFGVRNFKVVSMGKLDEILDNGLNKFQYVFVDEAHRFRNEATQQYEKLHKICFGKKVVLVSATPLNNRIEDIYSLLKLFQVPKQSNIPGVSNLEIFFGELRKRQNAFEKTDPEYVEIIKENATAVRDKVLRHVMVRRTRTEITKYFGEDLEKQDVHFPVIDQPKRIVYMFDGAIDNVFNETIELLKVFSYSRYTPLLFLKHQLSEFEKQGQRNVGGFMKGILVKRLESSFFAFKRTLRRFCESYTKFIDMYNSGNVYISNKVNVYDLLDADDESALLKLIDEDKVQHYYASEFVDSFIHWLQRDLAILNKIELLWANVAVDPKLEMFINDLNGDPILRQSKLIVFTESRETGEYLYGNLQRRLPNKVMFYSSAGGTYQDGVMAIPDARRLIMQNFDPRYESTSNDVKVLITTDVLAEGMNLHRSNVIVNYDLPWNPTRILQRVGRVNRVGSQHARIYVYNFFPSSQGDEHLGLEASIMAKIQAFHDTLGEDAKYLSDQEEVSTHELFGDKLYRDLNDRKQYEDEAGPERSELQYLQVIRKVRDQEPELFSKVKTIPLKSRSGRVIGPGNKERVASFIRQGRVQRFFVSSKDEAREVTFFEAVELFECDRTVKRLGIPEMYYALLEKNKDMLSNDLGRARPERAASRGRSNENYVIQRLKAKEMRQFKGFTDVDELFLKRVLDAFDKGIIPKNTSKRVKRGIEREINPLKVLSILGTEIHENILEYETEPEPVDVGETEIVVSEYLMGGSE